MRHEVPDGPVLHPFFISLWEVLEDHLSYGRESLAAIFGQAVEVLLDGQCGTLHSPIISAFRPWTNRVVATNLYTPGRKNTVFS